VVFEPVDVVLEAGDESGVAGDFAVPAALDGVVVEDARVGDTAQDHQ
jgi:hypothetical protein